MKIYTKTGDNGETGLFGGERVSKNSDRIEAYGTVDELNSFIGLALTEIKDEEISKLLGSIQNKLFVIGSDLATPENDKTQKLNIQRLDEESFKELEKAIDYFNEKLDELKNFILPGGTKGSALLHVARTISRRAERRVVALQNRVNTGKNIIIFLNRLSDLLFVLARYENKCLNISDTKWEK